MKSLVSCTLATGVFALAFFGFGRPAHAAPPELSITDIFPNPVASERGFQFLISGFYLDPENDVVSITAQVDGVGDQVSCLFDTNSPLNAFRCLIPFPGAGELSVTVAAVDAAGGQASTSTTITFELPDAPLLNITDVFPVVVSGDKLTALISGSFLSKNDIASFTVQVDGVTQEMPCEFGVEAGLFRCFPVFSGAGEALVTANALDVNGSIGSSSVTIDVPSACVDNRATLSQHRAAGRAELRFVFFAFRFFAVGSGDFLGSNGSSVVDLAETSPGFFEAGTCQ